jgi:hypothetical protein
VQWQLQLPADIPVCSLAHLRKRRSAALARTLHRHVWVAFTRK